MITGNRRGLVLRLPPLPGEARAVLARPSVAWCTLSAMSDHDHDFGLPDGYADPLNRPVDGALLGRFIGSAFDGCTSCQDAELTLVVSDPATCARLVELACVTAQNMFGGLPANMTDPDARGVASPEFRELARAGLDKANDAMFAACAEMRPNARRKAANTAADTIVGALQLGSQDVPSTRSE